MACIVQHSYLDTRRLPNGERLLLAPFAITIDGLYIEVPCGYVTDYSTLPLGTRWVVDWRKVDLAGVVHDWLYDNAELYGLSFTEANIIWRELALLHSNYAQAYAGFAGLELGAKAKWEALRA